MTTVSTNSLRIMDSFLGWTPRAARACRSGSEAVDNAAAEIIRVVRRHRDIQRLCRAVDKRDLYRKLVLVLAGNQRNRRPIPPVGSPCAATPPPWRGARPDRAGSRRAL